MEGGNKSEKAEHLLHPTPRIQLSVRPFVPICYMHHTYMNHRYSLCILRTNIKCT